MFPGTLLALWGKQMEHVAWNGFAFYDLIFPMFLFIAGISFPFSLSKSTSMGADSKSISLKIVRRGLTLVLLGILYNGLLDLDFENLRYASVLGRIGMAWIWRHCYMCGPHAGCAWPLVREY
jgi:predicted acyltransferase